MVDKERDYLDCMTANGVQAGRLPASELEQQQLLPAAEIEHETRQALA